MYHALTFNPAHTTGADQMLQTLLPSLRSLRSSLLTGALLVGSVYILFAHLLASAISIDPAAKQILGLAPFMPQLMLAVFCFLVGSLYVTGLEGLVDWFHRKTALKDYSGLKPGLKRWLLRSIAPLSDAARARIQAEGTRFFREFARGSQDCPNFEAKQQRFVEKVIAEILWMEGKLAGTPLLAPYEQYRSEGELRLSSALILPLVAAAAAHALGINKWGASAAMVASIPIALKLADYGLYYFRRAHSFLAHHVSDGTVLTPAMEALKRANPKPADPLPIVRLVPWTPSSPELPSAPPSP